MESKATLGRSVSPGTAVASLTEGVCGYCSQAHSEGWQQGGIPVRFLEGKDGTLQGFNEETILEVKG